MQNERLSDGTEDCPHPLTVSSYRQTSRRSFIRVCAAVGMGSVLPSIPGSPQAPRAEYNASFRLATESFDALQENEQLVNRAFLLPLPDGTSAEVQLRNNGSQCVVSIDDKTYRISTTELPNGMTLESLLMDVRRRGDHMILHSPFGTAMVSLREIQTACMQRRDERAPRQRLSFPATFEPHPLVETLSILGRGKPIEQTPVCTIETEEVPSPPQHTFVARH